MSDLDQRNAEAIESLRRVLVWCVSFVLVVLFALGAATFYLRGQDANRADEAKRLSAAIQQSRYESVLRGCQQDSARNGSLIESYRQAYEERVRTSPPEVAAALHAHQAASIAVFRALADAFLPKRTDAECARAAREATHVPLN